jgi:hypothetical protein
MKLNRLLQEYEVSFRHNPKQFYNGSFRVEMEEKRLIVVAVVKRHIGKNFRIVGIVKRRRET